MSAPREKLYKILVIGDLGTGKTSIIKRYVHQCFSPHYRATIGVDFALKVLNWDAKTIVRLQLWDIAGQERFGSMTRVYYKEAAGAFVVFDVTRSSTYEAVKIWKKDLDSKCFMTDGSPVPAVLLGNKCDLPSETPGAQQMEDFCKENNFLAYFPTSAKEDLGISDAARCLVAQVCARHLCGLISIQYNFLLSMRTSYKLVYLL
jgi:Ras-related protein Rab-32